MKAPIRKTLLYLSAILLTGCQALQAAETDRVKADAAAAVREPHFPDDEVIRARMSAVIEEGPAKGIIVGLLERDGSTRILQVGEAGAGAMPLSKQSVFEIGSVTKLFTAILLAQMVAEGQVSLSDSVSAHLPPRAVVPTRNGREISLLDLATHHAGLPRRPGDHTFSDPKNPYGGYTTEQLYEFLASYDLSADPGSKYEYSNVGFALLTDVLERRSGKSYAELVRERILSPLGMRRTGLELDRTLAPLAAKGHDEKGQVVPPFAAGAFSGAGALRSTAEDMLKFLAANLRPPETKLGRAIRESQIVRKQLDPHKGVALGWHVRSIGRDQKILFHTGQTPGFVTWIGFNPDEGVGLVLLANSGAFRDKLGVQLLVPPVPES